MKQTFLFLLTLITLNVFGQLPNNIPTNGLQIFYKFDYINNTNDLSGNARDGILTGDALLHIYNNCDIDSSASLFNTTNLVTSIDTIDFSNGQTISLWLKLAPFSSGDILKFEKFKIFYDIYKIYYTNGYDTLSIANPIPTENQWFNYTITLSKDSILNAYTTLHTALLENTHTIIHSSLGIIDDTLKIGEIDSFKNGICNLAIYNKALNSAEIDSLFICENTTSTSNINLINELNIYPIPADKFISINYKGNLSSIKIIDISGQEIYSDKVNKIDTHNIPNGVYTIIINNEFKKIISILHN